MSRSHPSVHPVDISAPPLTTPDEEIVFAPRRVRMKDIQGMPGTPTSLALRSVQFAFALVSLAVMATTSDFPSVTAFRYLVAAVSLQVLWSLSLAVVDIYALLVKRCLRNSKVVTLFTMGDGVRKQGRFQQNLTFIVVFTYLICVLLSPPVTLGNWITSTLTFAAACASAGITVLIGNDFNNCAQNHCTRFETATAMAFMSWFAVSPSFFLNFWSLASR